MTDLRNNMFDDLDINTSRQPIKVFQKDQDVIVVCPNCTESFLKAPRCPNCGQLMDYHEVKSRIMSLEEWVSKSSLRGIDAAVIADFVSSICQREGFSYHIGTVDLNLDMRLKNADKSVKLMMFCGGNNSRCEFQPKELYEYAERYGLSRMVVDDFFERMKKYLSDNQKNKPYERLNGYYSIDYSSLSGFLPSLRNEFERLYDSLDNEIK